jgi:hypothetical protein
MGNRTTSGMNKNRNLEINKPFYLFSDMLFDRVITVGPPKNLVLQTRINNDKKQMWVFD